MAERLGNWIEYQRRHLSPEMFGKWLDIQRQAGQGARIEAHLARQSKMSAAVRALDNLQRDMLKKVMAPAIEAGSEYLAKAEKAGVQGNRTGTLRQAIGSMKAKLYMSSLTAWAASGPRRGYGRIILSRMTKRGVKLKRTSKKQTEQFQGQISTFADPVRYAHFLITGRQASVAGIRHGKKGAGASGKRALMDSFTGRFFGHSVKAAAPRDFMAPAAAGADQAAAIATQEMNTNLNEYLYLAPE